uniref:Uncharacterized protein n=1 Tax=Glossina pallidipes TaxID=7398 RepID=A0A1A9ZR49_GLOPL
MGINVDIVSYHKLLLKNKGVYNEVPFPKLQSIKLTPFGIETTQNNANFGVKSLTVLLEREKSQKRRSLKVKEPFLKLEISNGPYENIPIHSIDVNGKDYFSYH